MPKILTQTNHSDYDEPDMVLLRFVENVPDLEERCLRAFARYLESPAAVDFLADLKEPVVRWQDIGMVPDPLFAAEGLTVVHDQPADVKHVDAADNILEAVDPNSIEHQRGCALFGHSAAECTCRTSEARAVVEEAQGA